MKTTILLVAAFLLSGCGAGGIKQSISLGGIYAIKHPDGYPVVCFVEGGNVGGIFCMKDSDLK